MLILTKQCKTCAYWKRNNEKTKLGSCSVYKRSLTTHSDHGCRKHTTNC